MFHQEMIILLFVSSLLVYVDLLLTDSQSLVILETLVTSSIFLVVQLQRRPVRRPPRRLNHRPRLHRPHLAASPAQLRL